MILGVDPGSVSGAYALLSEDGTVVDVADIPVVDRQINASGFWYCLSFRPISMAVVETVGAMPKQGVSSSFRFGMAVGIIHGVVASLGVPMVNVTPSKWKRYYNLDSDGEKSRALALKFWPEATKFLSHKKDHGRAEAMLLARYYLKTGMTK